CPRSVHVGVSWRPDARSADMQVSWTDDGDLLTGHIQPEMHSDLIVARDASLGNDSSFLKLIRIVKHLNRTWRNTLGEAPLSSFVVEVLALEVCRRPFALAEGVTDFLRRSASLVRGPLSHPLAAGTPLRAARPSDASALLARA